MSGHAIGSALWKFLSAHQVAATAISASLSSWAFSAYASTVNPPGPEASRRAKFWFAFVHSVAANLDKLKGRS